MRNVNSKAAASSRFLNGTPLDIRCFCVFTASSNFEFSYYYLNAVSHHIPNVRLFYRELYFYFG